MVRPARGRHIAHAARRRRRSAPHPAPEQDRRRHATADRVSSAFRTRLEAELTRTAASPATTIIVSEATGRPYLPDHFRHNFAAIRAAAAKRTPCFEIDHLMPGRDMADPAAFYLNMRDLTFMQLRHTAVTRLAEAGCDTTLISSITGHSQDTVTALMARYMVRTSEMARLAFQRRMDAEAPKLPAVTTLRGTPG